MARRSEQMNAKAALKPINILPIDAVSRPSARPNTQQPKAVTNDIIVNNHRMLNRSTVNPTGICIKIYGT